MMWFLQIAQLSTTISQAHRATAFHCDMVSRLNISHPAREVDLLDFEPLLAIPSLSLSFANSLFNGGCGCGGRIGHINVGHGVLGFVGGGKVGDDGIGRGNGEGFDSGLGTTSGRETKRRMDRIPQATRQQDQN